MILAAKALIIKNGKYLLLERSNDHPHFEGMWDFPGGRQNENETLEQTLIREVKEETNLNIIPDKIEKDFDYIHDEYKEVLHFNIFSIKSYTGELKISEDHIDYTWFAKDKLPKNLHPAVKLFFKR